MKSRKANRSKRVDPSCRNNGPCAWCRGSRTHANARAVPADAAEQEVTREEWAAALAEEIVEGPLSRDYEWRAGQSAFRHAAALWSRYGLDDNVWTAEELEKSRKAAQTALARHRRNKARYGV